MTTELPTACVELNRKVHNLSLTVIGRPRPCKRAVKGTDTAYIRVLGTCKQQCIQVHSDKRSNTPNIFHGRS